MEAEELYKRAHEIIYSDDADGIDQAIDMLAKAAVKGYIPAVTLLAEQYKKKKPNLAAEWYRFAYKKTSDPKFAYRAGRIYYTSVLPYETKRSMPLLFKAAEGRWGEAIELLAFHYSVFEPLDEKAQKRVFKILSSIENERYIAELDETQENLNLLLGNYYMQGLGTEKNPQKAFESYSLAAKMGSQEAILEIGKCFLSGVGTQKDPKKALDCFYETEFFSESKYFIGRCLLYGEGIEKDEKDGIEFLRRAAEQSDNGDAMYLIALCMLEGRGLPKDDAGGIEMMKRALEVGSSFDAHLYLSKRFPEEYPLD